MYDREVRICSQQELFAALHPTVKPLPLDLMLFDCYSLLRELCSIMKFEFCALSLKLSALSFTGKRNHSVRSRDKSDRIRRLPL